MNIQNPTLLHNRCARCSAMFIADDQVDIVVDKFGMLIMAVMIHTSCMNDDYDRSIYSGIFITYPYDPAMPFLCFDGEKMDGVHGICVTGYNKSYLLYLFFDNGVVKVWSERGFPKIIHERAAAQILPIPIYTSPSCTELSYTKGGGNWVRSKSQRIVCLNLSIPTTAIGTIAIQR